MRVVAGSARSVNLIAPNGKGTRPTTDRIKETLFNVIQADTPDARVLDLFAGSGALGIEALSRGAESAVFVDNSREALECISTNLKKTRLEDKSEVIAGDYMTALKRLSAKNMVFDLVFIDPPYGQGLEQSSVSELMALGLAGENALIVVEESIEHKPDGLISLGLRLEKCKDYKSNRHYFFRV